MLGRSAMGAWRSSGLRRTALWPRASGAARGDRLLVLLCLAAAHAFAMPPFPVPLGDLNPGSSQPIISEIQDLGGHVVFYTVERETFHDNYVVGILWSSDGTPEGTVSIGTFFSQSDRFEFYENDGERVRFWATAAFLGDVYGFYWTVINTDGTLPGTIQCMGESYYDEPQYYQHQCEPWPTDLDDASEGRDNGTTTGKSLLLATDVRDGFPVLLDMQSPGEPVEIWRSPLASATRIYAVSSAAGQILFLANVGDRLAEFRVDEATQRAVLVRNIGYNTQIAGSVTFNERHYFTRGQTEYNYFTCYGPNTEPPELWGSDGSPEGTVRTFTRRIFGPESDWTCQAITGLHNAEGRLFFWLSSNGRNYELWCTDGTRATLRRAYAIDSATRVPYTSEQCSRGGVYFFYVSSEDGLTEFWRSDGTPAGTFMLDRDTEKPHDAIAYHYVWAIDGNAYALFTKFDVGNGWQLYATDGTLENTGPVAGFTDDAPPTRVLPYRGTKEHALFYLSGERPLVFVSANDLSITEGLPRGRTVTLSNLIQMSPTRSYFMGSTPEDGREYWTTDGTLEGTRSLASFNRGVAGSSLAAAMPLGNGMCISLQFPTNQTWLVHNVTGSKSLLPVPLKPLGRWGDNIIGEDALARDGRAIGYTDGTALGTGRFGPRSQLSTYYPVIFTPDTQNDVRLLIAEQDGMGDEPWYLPAATAIESLTKLPITGDPGRLWFQVTFTQPVIGVNVEDFRVVAVGAVVPGETTLERVSAAVYRLGVDVAISGTARVGLAVRADNHIVGVDGHSIGGFGPQRDLDYLAGEYHYFYAADDGTDDPDGLYSADIDGNYWVTMSEVLRIIQFYNAGGFHCADSLPGTEDGFAPGQGRHDGCLPHDSDRSPQDWRISVGEVLRAVQFYNSNGYSYCPDADTEDGFCPGP